MEPCESERYDGRMSDALTPREVAAYTAIVKSAALLHRAVDRALAEHGGLTRVQFEILTALASAPEGLRMFELADRLVHSRNGLTYQLSQLEKAGLASRAHDETNGRAVIARITKGGEQVRASLTAEHTDLVRRRFAGALDPSELDLVASALSKVVSSLSEDTDA